MFQNGGVVLTYLPLVDPVLVLDYILVQLHIVVVVLTCLLLVDLVV